MAMRSCYKVIFRANVQTVGLSTIKIYDDNKI